jgi:Na+/proline symporter
LLPPLLWRVQSPIPDGATDEMVRMLKEEAYIKSCTNVLPLGMVGLMMAAMFSATASTISGQLNVFSSVLTQDIYRPLRKAMTDKHLLAAGRWFTLLLGAIISGLALCIPMMGGAEKVIISVTEIMVVPLLAPILFGLLSKRLNTGTLWATAGICIPLGLAVHFHWIGADANSAFGKWLMDQSMTIIGVVLPLIIVLIGHLLSRKEDRHWANIEELRTNEVTAMETRTEGPADHSPARIVAWSMVVLGASMACLIPINPEQRLIIFIFAIVLAAIGAAILWGTKKANH